LVSYLVLWVLVLGMALLLIGLLRQIGLMQAQRQGPADAPEPPEPRLENDGPPIGSRLPVLEAETMNGFGRIALAASRPGERLLLIFMSPLCESCQHVVEALNALAEDGARGVRPIVIMRADDHACRAFNAVFPLRMPLVCDGDRTITMGFNVHGAPVGLLYDAGGALAGKGGVTGHESLLALLAAASAAPAVASPGVLV
jgi:methylamine dehydrogenase accessory protein MauD